MSFCAIIHSLIQCLALPFYCQPQTQTVVQEELCPIPKSYLYPVKPLRCLHTIPTPNYRKWVGVGQHHNNSQHPVTDMTQWPGAGVGWGSFQPLKTLWILCKGVKTWRTQCLPSVCHLCVTGLTSCHWSLLCGGLGHGVTGAVANTGEGFLAGQRPHAIHPVSYGVPRCGLWAALFQQLIGWPGREGGSHALNMWAILQISQHLHPCLSC